MSVYLQMGHNTQNLIGETDLEEYKGIILSPVNETPASLREMVPIFRNRGDYDIILDPQLYYPRGQRENLIQQPYFPNNFDTTNFSDVYGWSEIIDKLTEFAKELKVNSITSPVYMPGRWTDEFYDTCVETSRVLSNKFKNDGRVLTTCLVSITDLDEINRVKQITSILTRHDTGGFYVVIDTEIEPRRELSDANGLAALMSLINILNKHAPVTVAFSSSDMILFKAAGASNCCTSKYFNLRRFTTSRFEEPPTGGGGQLPYWFEHNLLAFLRETDIRRLQKDGYGGIIGGLNSNNHTGQGILELFKSNPGEAWLGMSWRQYLSWFGKTEAAIDKEGLLIVREWLKEAEQNWQRLNEDEVLMSEPRNDGGWIRSWRQAVRDFSHSAKQ